MISINLTQEQANNLLQLLDVAIKAGGYSNAKAALPIIEIVLQAGQQQPQE
jgi:hypothetical protein